MDYLVSSHLCVGPTDSDVDSLKHGLEEMKVKGEEN